MKLRPIKLGLVVAALTLSTFAFADDPQPDSVFLRNGTSARGHISEMIAYDHVTIVLPGGETKRFAWKEVEHVLVGSQSAFGPPPPAAPPPPAPKVAMDDVYIHVHFTASGSSETAFLYRSPAGTMDWETVCQAPCDADLPLHDRYRIGGNGAPTKDVFLRGSGSIHLHAEGRSTAGVVFGGILMVLGSLVSIAAMGGGNEDNNSGFDGTRFLILTAVGAAMLGTGIALYVKSASTDIEQRPAAAAKAEAAVRRPTWRSLTAVEQSAPPTFPVLYEARF